MTTKSIRERINAAEELASPRKSSTAEVVVFKTTRSCYFCSAHHPLAKGVIGNLLGRNEFFCSQACKDKVLRPKAALLARIESK